MIQIEEIIETYPNLFSIDKKLNSLVQKIELLNYINPINFLQKFKLENINLIRGC